MKKLKLEGLKGSRDELYNVASISALLANICGWCFTFLNFFFLCIFPYLLRLHTSEQRLVYQ
jgi:hypothetical protein